VGVKDGTFWGRTKFKRKDLRMKNAPRDRWSDGGGARGAAWVLGPSIVCFKKGTHGGFTPFEAQAIKRSGTSFNHGGAY